MNHAVPRSRYVAFGLIVSLALAWDLVSKWWAFELLGGPHRWSDWLLTGLWGEGVFRLETNFNRGALWGIGQGKTWLFASLCVAAVGMVLYWLFWRGAARSWSWTVALSLIMAGTLGNLYDRLGLHGWIDAQTGRVEYAVRDFLAFTIPVINYPWPVFNFADTYLVVGASLLVLQSFRNDLELLEAQSEQSLVKSAPSKPAPVAANESVTAGVLESRL
jgi:signal peptidase II